MSFIDWKDLFEDTFEAYPNKWTLNHVHRNNTNQYSKLQNQRKMERIGYARFHCPKCSNNWASGKAMVVLYFSDTNQPLGKVALRLYGQQCKKCSHTQDYFVDPEFENDFIQLTVTKLYERIGCLCYGKKRPPKKEFIGQQNRIITGPHEKKLCEACRLGICDQTLIIKKH